MKHRLLLISLMLFLSFTGEATEKTEAKHLGEVRKLTQQTLPYSLDQTRQSFTKTVHGGVQLVVAKSANDTKQIKLIQSHLQKIAGEFRKGDFSATERIHGADMPGLARLKRAEPDDIRYEYKPLADGGQIHYSSEYPELVQALHEWFDAQSLEHGSGTVPGHADPHSTPSE